MKSGIISPRREKTKTRRLLLQVLGFACLAASALPARAQTPTTWDGGTGNWSDPTFWNNGVPNSASADVYIDGDAAVSSVVTMDNSYTVGRLTVDAGDTLNLANNVDFTVTNGSFGGSGAIINNGTINFNSSGSGVYLHTNGPLSLTGTGTINLTGSNDRIYANSAGDRVTVGAGQTVAGTGNLGIGQTTFTNSGLVTANQNGNALVIQPGGGNGNDFTNTATGVLQGANGGLLQLSGSNGGAFTGGKLQALAGSQVQLQSGANVHDTTLATVGTGTVNVIDAATLTNVTNTGALVTNNDSTLTLVGALTNNGTFTLNSTGNGNDLRISGPVSLAGTGTVTLNGVSDRVFANSAGDRLTIGAGQTVAGTGNLGIGQTTFTNNGVVTANQNGNTLLIQPGGGNGNDFTNAGTGLARAENGGTLQLYGGNGGVFTGNSFSALAGSQVAIGDGANVLNATLTTVGTGVVNVYNSATLTGVTNTGNLVGANDSVTTLVGTFTNNATFNLNSTGNGDDLRLNGPVILAGTGVANLNGVNDRLYALSSGDRLTISPGATVAGSGNLGIGQTTFTNSGLVSANVNGSTLILQPGGGNGNDFTQTGSGTAQAVNGGTLALIGASGGIFTGSTFQALAGSQVTIGSGAVINGATLATTGTGVVTVTDSATLTNVNNLGNLVGANDSVTTLVGTFTNNATFNLNSSGNGDDLRFTGSVNLAGTGTINLNGVSDRIYATNAGGDRLTIAATQTITGSGNLGIGQSTFTNNGILNANVNGSVLTIQTGGGNGNDFTNTASATTEATNGGTLALLGSSGGNFNSGTFQALAGSQVTIGSGAVINGATLATTGTGTVLLTDTATLANATNNGTLNANNDSVTFLAGTLTNNGTFTLASAGNGDDLRFVGSATLAGTGTLNLTGVSNRVYANNAGGDRLTINAGATIAGTGNLGAGQSTFTNSGTVNANVNGSLLTIQPGGGNGNDFTNAGTGLVEATGGGTLTFTGANGGFFTNNGTFTVNSSGAAASSSFAVDASRLTNFTSTTLTGGTYNVISSNTASTSTLSFGGGTITANAANVTLSGASTVFTEINTLATNQGSFAVANGRNFTTVGALANSGTLVAAGGSTLTVTGPLTQSSTGILTGNGTYAATAFTISGAVNPGGTVSTTTGAFADAAGTTTLDGPAAFDVATQFHFELGSTTGTNDRLAINGTLNLNGTLNVLALAGFGTGTYELISFPVADLLMGGGLTLGTKPAGYTYQIVYLPGQVDLAVVQTIPEPGAWAFVLGGATLLVGVRHTRRHGRRGL